MPLNAAPIQNPLVSQGGAIAPVWVRFFTDIYNALNNTQPQPLPSYTVTTLPSAASFTGYLIYVSNESGGAIPAFSDGTNWRRVSDRAIVS